MKRILLATVGLLAALSLRASPVQAQDVPTDPGTDPTTEAQKDWNFLIYLNGVNSLDEFGPININQMEQVGSTANINVIVEWGSASQTTTQRLLIKKDNDQTKVTSPAVQTLPAVDMGDVKSLVDFAKWAQAAYPSKHTFIVVWDHGNGWHFTNLKGMVASPIHASDISWDDHTGHYITTEQLGQAMNDIAASLGHKVDIYGSDACLMGMAEVAGEMKDSVQYFLGSQEVEPGLGWPYQDFLAHWAANPAMDAADIAKTLSHDYGASYEGGSNGNDQATMAVYDMSKFDALTAAVKQLSGDLLKLPPAKLTAFKNSIANMKSFTDTDYKDLIDMLDQGGLDNVVKASSQNLRQAAGAFILANDQNLDAMTHGLSIWLPTDQFYANTYIKRYHGLVFSKNSDWDKVISALFNVN